MGEKSTKDKMKAHFKKRRYEKRKEQSELFQQMYNKTRIFKFPSVDEINMEQYVCLHKLRKNFHLSLPAIAVYPVLCVNADFEQNNWFQISQENIAKMAGISINTVSKGIKELEDVELLERKKQTDGKRHFYVYRIEFIRKGDIQEARGDYFTFHKCIIDSGVWADLKPRAKALYLAMRSKAEFSVAFYLEIEYPDIYFGHYKDKLEVMSNILDHGEGYRNRKWDLCMEPLSKLCELGDISRSNLTEPLNQLMHHRLIEHLDEYINSVFKVYLKPKI